MARRAERSADLADYAAKRDFARTPEPAGEVAAGSPDADRMFVVQRHRARRLHYDLRLEVDGVLASWAVPKGPTLDPARRSLAVQVEDHPMEYADFEGVIPAGEYGGGDVIVWDRGTWTPARTDDPAAAIAKGDLHFDLHGEKLAGRFVLIRRNRDGGGRAQWLLLHKNDDAARPGWDPEDHPHSVKSGRTNDEVAVEPDALWRSDLPPGEAEIAVERGTRGGAGDGRSTARPGAPPGPRSPGPPAPAPAEWEAPSEDEMAALDALGREGRWHVQGHRLALTNLDKVLFPGRDGEPPLTKRDLVRYHASVAPTMLRYLAGRPVNMHRYPDGVDRPGFWHKEVPEHAPGWLRRWRNRDADEGETERYLVPDSTAALVWLANYGAVELHPWTSTAAAPDQPSWVLFDIDPGDETSFEDVLVLARLHRTALGHLGVVGVPTVSGQRGVQVRVPVRPGYSFDDTRRWAETVSRSIGATVPDMVTWAWNRAERGGLARLDYTQNAVNKTLVVPYGARPRAGAPVCVPIGWDELDDPDLRPDRWTVRTVLDRLAGTGDPLAPLAGLEQDLPSLG